MVEQRSPKPLIVRSSRTSPAIYNEDDYYIDRSVFHTSIRCADVLLHDCWWVSN